VGSSPASGFVSRTPRPRIIERMSEHSDPSEDAPVDPRDDEESGADEEPQPWAKALPGDDEDD
jgi:hypothetical protein